MSISILHHLKKITPILGYCFFTFLFCFVFPGVYDCLLIFLTLFAFITARTFSFQTLHHIIYFYWMARFPGVFGSFGLLRMVIYLDWWTVVFLGLFRSSSDLELLFPASRLFLFSGSHPSFASCRFVRNSLRNCVWERNFSESSPVWKRLSCLLQRIMTWL